MKVFRNTFYVYFLLLTSFGESSWSPVCVGDAESGCNKTDEDGKVVIFCDYQKINDSGCPPKFADKPIFPQKPQDLHISSFVSTYKTQSGWPGLNVTWRISYGDSAQYLKGFQVFMLGLSVGSDFMKERCHTFNLSQTDFSQQIFTDNPELSFFYDDCLRSLNPGDQYEIVVRSLPYDPIENNEVRSIYTIPGCSHASMKEAKYCLDLTGRDDPAMWMPLHLSLTPGYSLVNVSFDLAPPEYGFNQYYVGLYQCTDTKLLESCQPVRDSTLLLPYANDSNKIYNTTINRIPVESMIFTVLYDIPVGETYHVSITPWPYPNTCKTPSGNPTTCITTISYPFNATSNPCASAPCLNGGNCTPDQSLYHCQCPPGGFDPAASCHDIDECVTDPCEENSKCNNTAGSYLCPCLPGFEGDDGRVSSCSDIDECITDPCKENSECQNTDGSYLCPCLAGFEGDGRVSSCSDINECEIGNGGCHVNASCLNWSGSSSCLCGPGFEGNGSQCSKADLSNSGPALTSAQIGTITATILSVILVIALLAFSVWLCQRERKKHNQKKSYHVNETPDSHQPNIKLFSVAPPSPRVLVIYSHDCRQFVDVVDSLCAFLHGELGIAIVYNEWNILRGETFSNWICEQFAREDVTHVLFVASKGTSNALLSDRRAAIPSLDRQPDLVTPAMSYINADLALANTKSCRKKYVTVYFSDFSCYSDIPRNPLLTDSYSCFRLPSDVEKLYRMLLEIPNSSPNSSRIRVELEEKLKGQKWKKLQQKIGEMSRYVSANPDWYMEGSNSNDSLAGSHPSEGSRAHSPNPSDAGSIAVKFVNFEDSQNERLDVDDSFPSHPNTSGYYSGDALSGPTLSGDANHPGLTKDWGENKSLGSEFHNMNMKQPVLPQHMPSSAYVDDERLQRGATTAHMPAYRPDAPPGLTAPSIQGLAAPPAEQLPLNDPRPQGRPQGRRRPEELGPSLGPSSRDDAELHINNGFYHYTHDPNHISYIPMEAIDTAPSNLVPDNRRRSSSPPLEEDYPSLAVNTSLDQQQYSGPPWPTQQPAHTWSSDRPPHHSRPPPLRFDDPAVPHQELSDEEPQTQDFSYRINSPQEGSCLLLSDAEKDEKLKIDNFRLQGQPLNKKSTNDSPIIKFKMEKYQ